MQRVEHSTALQTMTILHSCVIAFFLIEKQGAIMSKLVLQPSSIQSHSHRKLKALNQYKPRTAKLKTKEHTVFKDPEQEKREREQEENESNRFR